MKIKFELIRTFFRQGIGISLIGICVAVMFTLIYREVLEWQNFWISGFILLHSIALAVCLGRTRSEEFVYIYTRGYSRDELWLNKMIASLLMVLAVWLPGALVIWLGFRSKLQDMLSSPYYPFVDILEVNLPWFWLFGYLLLLPMFHYVWIRRAQPSKGSEGAVLLAIGMVVLFFDIGWFNDWFLNLTLVVSLIIIITAFVGGFFMHRKLEVK